MNWKGSLEKRKGIGIRGSQVQKLALVVQMIRSKLEKLEKKGGSEWSEVVVTSWNKVVEM